MGESKPGFNFSCPMPIERYPVVLLGHGGGGRLTHQMISAFLEAGLENDYLHEQLDSAVISLTGLAAGKAERLAFTTDSYVVTPLFFPGGDIGKLAVFGTVNDLAMVGARPIALSLSLIIEEGLPTEELFRVVTSVARTAREVGVKIATGDTKVVERGKADKLFINTSGIGLLEHRLEISPSRVRPGDAVIISGDIGRHGMAIMRVREGLSFDSQIESDCACLWPAVRELLKSEIEIHALRDLTRGGLASGLVEIATQGNLTVEVRERDIPIDEAVLAGCEILGFDPLYVANEGCFILFVPNEQAELALATIRQVQPVKGLQAQIVGRVLEVGKTRVILKSRVGSSRVVEMFSGEQLPRIC